MEKVEIKQHIEGFMDDLFFEFQNSLGITSGDIHPLVAFRLEKAVDELADAIREGMNFQEEYCPRTNYEAEQNAHSDL